MNMFSNSKISTKLAIAFGFILVVMTSIAVYSFVSLKNNEQKIEDQAEIFNELQITSEIVDRMHELSRIIRNLALLEDKDELEEEIEGLIDRKNEIAEKAKLLGVTLTSPEEMKLFADIKEKRTAFMEVTDRLVDLSKQGDIQKYKSTLLVETRPLQLAYFKSVGNLRTYLNKMTKAHEQEMLAQAKKSKMIQVILTILSLISGIFFSVWITRSITKPLRLCIEVAESVAQGDLSRVEKMQEGTNEIGILGAAINKMEYNLKDAVLKISDSSSHVSSAATQLHSTSEQMATSSEELTAQSGSVATASEEMSATAADIANNCHSASDISRQASDTAKEGSRIISETVEAMSRIASKVTNTAKTIDSLGSRSEQIGQIVGTIEDIADQTNLLALNAAIEAARAGEQGRGFAVVADEVRALAERTTKATKEISDMIRVIQRETSNAVSEMEEGVKEVEMGTVKAMHSGEAMDRILSGIDDTSMQINQIATAAEEQSATTHEITANVHQIMEVSMQNSRGAQESSAAAEELSRLAQELQSVVSQFKL